MENVWYSSLSMSLIQFFRREMPSGSPDQVLQGVEDVVAKMEEVHFHERDIFAVRMALGEVLVNAVKHGNKLDATKTVELLIETNGSRMTFVVQDQGKGFKREEVPDCADDEHRDKPGGRGVKLTEGYMSKVEWDGNRVTMMLNLREPEPPRKDDAPKDADA